MKRAPRPSPNERHRRSDFRKACTHWDRGNTRVAFNLFLSLANRGDASSFLNLGYFFDCGIGVRTSESKALYWYKRAYRAGDASGANNVGTIYRDRGNHARALMWFSKALSLGEVGSAIEIAKLHLSRGKHLNRVPMLLKSVLDSDSVSEGEQEEAARLLRA